MQCLEALAQLAGLGVAQVHAVADPELAGRGAEQRRLNLTGPLLGVEAQAGGQMRARQPRGVARARRQIATAEQRRNRRRGLAHDGQGEQRGGPEAEPGVCVEQRRAVQTRPGGHLGDRVLGRGALDTPGAAAVDELEVAHLAHRRHRRCAARGELARRARLDEADRRGAQALTGRPIADAGDLRFVGHHPHQLEARPCGDLPGQRRRLLRRAHRGALSPDLHPAAQGPPAGVEVEADAQRRAVGSDRGVDQIELSPRVDHHRDQHLGVAGGQVGQLAQRGAVHRGVGDHQVPPAVAGEPQRFGEREGERAPKARVALVDRAQQRPAAHGLRRHADRRPAGAAQHVGRVAPERLQVNERERRVETGGGTLEALVLARGSGGSRARWRCRGHAGRRYRGAMIQTMRARLALLGSIAAVLAAGCGGGGTKSTSAGTTGGAGTAPTQPSGPNLEATGRPADSAAVRVIRGWTDAQRASDVDRATSYFAVPAVVQNGSPPEQLPSRKFQKHCRKRSEMKGETLRHD